MKSTYPLLTGRYAPLLAGIATLLGALILGFRGFTEHSLQWFERGSSSTGELLLDGFYPGAFHEVLLSFLGGLLPWSPGWTIVGLSFFSLALTGMVIYQLGARLSEALTGWLAVFFLLTSAPLMGAATAGDPTLLPLPFMGAILLIWFQDTLSPLLRGALLSALGGLSFLFSPLAALLFGLLFLIQLVLFRSVSLDRLLAPLGAYLLVGLTPFFLLFEPQTYLQYVLKPFTLPPEILLFRNTVYPPARPPFYFGVLWFLEQIPIITAMAMSLGVILGYSTAPKRSQVFAGTLSVWALLLSLLPSLLRTSRPLDLHFESHLIVLLAPLAALVTQRFFVATLGPSAPTVRLRRFAILGVIVMSASILVEARASLAMAEFQRSPLTARLTGWTINGDPPARQKHLPRYLLSITLNEKGATLFSPPFESYLAAYVDMGILTVEQVVSEPKEAWRAIRPAPTIAVRRYGVISEEHAPRQVFGETQVFPYRHQPAFFLDFDYRERAPLDQLEEAGLKGPLSP